MKLTLPLAEMTLPEKINAMEEIWADISKTEREYSPPDWHGQILEERRRLAQSGEVGFTDWETAKRQIKARVA
ncbi:addiction module antitoxin RelB [Opitutaceae bacterium TAV5]|nr:addiction module antitoxin RelB [Opitutaceae bacterium TAV5]